MVVNMGDLYSDHAKLQDSKNAANSGLQLPIIENQKFTDEQNQEIRLGTEEGLNVSLMEAMASGVPCIVSRIRGNVDLISNSKCLVGADDVEGWKCAVKNMVNCIQSGQIPDVKKNEWQIRQYGISSVHKQMEDIYQSVIGKSQKKFGSDKN